MRGSPSQWTVVPAAQPLSSRCSGEGWRWMFRCRTAMPDAVQPLAFAAVRTPKMARVEAALFVADVPLSERRLMQVAVLADAEEAIQHVDALNRQYDQERSPFRIEKLATGYQLLTRPQYAPWLDRIHHRKARPRLSPPLMETLVVIAYRQPVTRADVEAVRGVQCAEVIKQLMDKGLVRVIGEDDSLGRPYLYGTTRTFLEYYGLQSLDDLPLAEKLRSAAVPRESEQQTDTGDENRVSAA